MTRSLPGVNLHWIRVGRRFFRRQPFELHRRLALEAYVVANPGERGDRIEQAAALDVIGALMPRAIIRSTIGAAAGVVVM